jgi:hypothetical protein
MQWDDGCICSFDPAWHCDAYALCTIIGLLWASFIVLQNLYIFIYTRIGLKAIKSHFKNVRHSCQSAQFKEIEFPNKRRFDVINLILNTFTHIERLKSKDHFFTHRLLGIRNLENQIEAAFLKRHLFLFLFIMAVFSCSILWDLSITKIYCLLTVLAYISARGIFMWISARIKSLSEAYS